jgi:Na+-driven multidrug efflux pump
MGAGQSEGVKSTIKKTILISTSAVFMSLLVISLYPNSIVSLFDKTGSFTAQASKILPIISVFVLFDVVQLILSAALRGISQVRLVMNTRILLSFLFFIPITFLISNFINIDSLLKFLLLYGTFYVSSALMACFYVYKFRCMDSSSIRKIV